MPVITPKAVLFCAFNVPALIVVIPVYEFAPLSTKAPIPSFVKVNAVFAALPNMIFDTVMVVPVATPILIKLAPRAIPVDAVFNVNDPASAFILVSEETVTNPVIVLAPNKFLIAPSLFTPVPYIVNGFANDKANALPSICNALPLFTVNEPAVVPNILV